jgi:hypothetical protein
MTRPIAELEAIVRKRICAVCTERTTDGGCGLPEPAGCELFALFPRVAGAIESVNSDDIRDYLQAIREQVCTVCAGRAGDGSCEKRQQVRCSLDAYLLLVVEAIEEATGKSFDRGGLTPVGSAPAAGLARKS